jgi:hypothetical protein
MARPLLSPEGSLEATRRYILEHWPDGASEALTFEAAVMAHAWDARHPGGGPVAAAAKIMTNHQGNYATIREWYDNFSQTGVLWAGNPV